MTVVDGTMRHQNGEMFSSASVSEQVEALLRARPAGLREPLLLALTHFDDNPTLPLARHAAAVCTEGVESSQLRKLRNACKRIGAKRDDDMRWVLR
jgi:hypothetical protein